MKKLIQGYKVPFYLFTLFNMLVPLTNVAFAYSIKFIIDAGMSNNQSALTRSIVFGIGVILLYAMLNYLAFHYRNKLVEKLMNNYNNHVFKTILDKDYKDFSSENSGKFISMLTDNMNKVEEDYLLQFFNITRNISLMVFSLAAMFVGNWLLTVFVIVACIIPMIISGGVGKKAMDLQKEGLCSEQRYVAKIKDILLGFLVVKSFNIKDTITTDFIQERERLSKVKSMKDTVDSIARVISELSGMLVFLVAFGGGMYMVFNGNSTMGSVTAIVQLVNFVVMPLNELGVGFSKFKQGQVTLSTIDFDDQAQPDKGKKKDQFTNVIEFKNVDFSYTSDEKQKALSDVSFKVERGEKIALVGTSGSGKTTLMNLLLRFYDAKSGEIAIDSDDIEELSLESVYNLMTVVQQDVYVFDDTLRANITLNEQFSEESIYEAVRLSGLSEFVEKNDQGLDSLCGENGSLLSGGQKQRLSIARSLIRRTPILLLDEATSSLDNQTTLEIENSILDIQDLTALIITHKLNESSLKKYDRILFMKNGKIIEHGHFEQLIKNQGEFYNLFQLAA
ncbi:ABC transporter ATP-binding protein [Enterococcus sp. BWB1-3]|uniref:ABC transporter ATP-binding protein n=1 Tax=Enterococcus sp. BWB1-3 TaxID=2787713 RepID=UPI0019233841|nr:ABC transporter ATP-binding protein [Enterococcus sp. BWB1-3]MBL1228787.1 ABC transporter ATP-binding protein [Enterococcus sp. BWB1-3]